MKIKGAFFDLYGTLLMYGDMSAAWNDWLSEFHRCLHGCGLGMSRDEFALSCDGFFSKPEPTDNGDGLTVLERRIMAHCDELSLTPSRDQLSETAFGVAVAWQKYVSLDPETPIVLNHLKSRVPVALISNFDHPPNVRATLSELSLTQYFDSIVISADVGFKKPDPRIFSVALKETGLRSDEVIYVGDTSEDVDGAVAAGMKPILIQRRDESSKGDRFDFKSADQEKAQDSIVIDGVRVIGQLSELLQII
ncbi:MAG: HAD family hydrolase [candidate division Zixibacteria bacterium]|nr:HAD family hydrolase [candidate division Zixibacteria bacterium]MBU1470441.1 HAD family hydrolase [candidate division Zixibacteria bacterium]MBU2625890.1 HAD family hydrolase [candidate division Zixibacteria bacterium]